MKYNIKDVRTGMVLRKDVVTPSGTIIISKGTELTYDLIQRIKSIEITVLDIVNTLIEEPDDEDLNDEREQMYLDNVEVEQQSDVDTKKVAQIRSTEQYKRFYDKYASSLSSFEANMSDFLNHQNAYNPQTLIEKTKNILYPSSSSAIDILRMMICMEGMDASTYAHSVNVSIIARILGEWMGMPEQDLDTLTLGGLLHDIGKLDLDKEVLFKPGKLTQREFEIVKQHPMKGYTHVQKNSHISEDVKMCVLQHHEKTDGSGYPLSYRGDQINRFARIITIADVYDALTANRCYRTGMSPFKAAAIIQKEAFEKYHPNAALTFLKKIVNSYLGDNASIEGDREVKILQINDSDLIHPLVLETATGTVIDLHKTGEEIVKIL